MQLIRESRIDGVFEGYVGGRVYLLADGSRWRQADNKAEYVYREGPKARLFRHESATYLDVEGTSGVVLVVPDSGRWAGGAGAY
jgi:hypothetical protein